MAVATTTDVIMAGMAETRFGTAGEGSGHFPQPPQRAIDSKHGDKGCQSPRRGLLYATLKHRLVFVAYSGRRQGKPLLRSGAPAEHP